jgi:oxygen-independent coproporphyrinogen-3 oxidase
MAKIQRTEINKLVEKYGTAVPRYTSYPTAPEWQDEFSQEKFEAAITKSNESKKDFSLYLHIPFCESQCYFCGCNVVISPKHGIEEAYLEHLFKEIRYYGKLFSKDRKVAQMAWGGGTPTFLTPDQIRRLYGVINESFSLYTAGQRNAADEISEQIQPHENSSDARLASAKKRSLLEVNEHFEREYNAADENFQKAEYEYAIEIDPRVTSVDHLQALYDCGFNRLSMGIQDFNHTTQIAINRVQSKEEVQKLTQEARQIGFTSINYDLIYGLPFQTMQSFSETVEIMKELEPDRIALFNYAHLPSMIPHQKKYILDETLPDKKTKLEIFDHAVEEFTNQGYEFIGIDHFAKKTDSLVTALKNKSLYRNFQGYTTFAGCDMISFGITAISDIQGVYKQNPKKINDYYSDFKQAEKTKYSNEDDLKRREIIRELMCNNFAILNKDIYLEEIKLLYKFVQDGIVTLTEKENLVTIEITDLGRFFSRNVASLFDNYLNKTNGFKAFSQAL